MIISVTKLELKSPFLYFSMMYWAIRIMKQLKSSNCITVKTRGLGANHYTLSAWENRDHLNDFYRKGDHSLAMKKSTVLAKRVITYSYSSTDLPTWKEAKKRLKKGKVISFG
jgi:hypothetical protein